MSDTTTRPDPPEPDDALVSPPEEPSIPDGGLGSSMPEWLQRPPAWRGITVREPRQRDLPPPDTSVIDPRTILEIDDLPVWLQRIAARAADPEATMSDSSHDAEAPEETARDAAAERPPPVQEQSSAPIPEERPIIALHLPPTSYGQAHWWRTRAALIGLAVAVLLIGVWVVLIAV